MSLYLFSSTPVTPICISIMVCSGISISGTSLKGLLAKICVQCSQYSVVGDDHHWRTLAF
uniref:Uncharacterized protein n=1 Tax=Arundo donax TaxID=35708 RepID=A0A0A9DR69_ARUDO